MHELAWPLTFAIVAMGLMFLAMALYYFKQSLTIYITQSPPLPYHNSPCVPMPAPPPPTFHRHERYEQ
jgi:hypothetical protein